MEGVTVRDGKELAAAIIEHIHDAAREAIRTTGGFRVALSGGSLVSILNNPLFRDSPSASYDKWTVFLADERCVPLDDSESTYGMYLSEMPDFVSKVNFPVPYGTGIPEDAARQYGALLDRALDLVVLGIGPDGHTASLFPPASAAMAGSTERVEVVHNSPKPPATRITMTLPYLCTGNQIAFVVTGAGKAEKIRQILFDHDASLPPSAINRTGKARWFLDYSAASLLQ